jgi:hypothetical protein
MQMIITVKPELTATSEQRPPVNDGQYNSVMARINLTFIRAPLSNSHFFRSRWWPLCTGLNVICICLNSILDRVRALNPKLNLKLKKAT